jgi:hypothetical protein
MVARYETGASSPTVAARQRCLRAAGCELVLASQLLGNPELGYGDLSRSPVTLLRKNRVAIRAAATRLRARNVRIFGPAVRGGAPLSSRADRCSGWPAGWRTSPGSGSMCWQRKHSPGRLWRGPSPRRCRYDVG